MEENPYSTQFDAHLLELTILPFGALLDSTSFKTMGESRS
jgi:hypothetical protein